MQLNFATNWKANQKLGAGVIESFGGRVIRLSDRQMIGAWGLPTLASGDPRCIVAAARAVASELKLGTEFGCSLHAPAAKFGPNGATDDDVVLALAGRTPSVMMNVIVASETFRSMCCAYEILLPISIPGHQGSKPGQLYAVPTAAAEDDRSIVADPPPHGGSALAPLLQLDQIGDLREVILAAAIAGKTFTAPLLARMLEIAPQRLQSALEAACASKLLRLDMSSSCQQQYTFCDPTLHRTAYSMVPVSDRLRLHRKAVRLPNDRVNNRTQSEIIAQYHCIARNARQSKRWLGKAARQAIAKGELRKAIEHLQNALDQDADAAHSTAIDRSLLQSLSVQLAQLKGNGSEEVFNTYSRSISLATESVIPMWGQEFRSLWLAQTFHIVKGEVRAAMSIGNLLKFHLRQSASKSENVLTMRLLTKRVLGLTLMLAGDLPASLEHYDYVIANYDPKLHADLRFSYGSDQEALAHAHTSWLHALADNAVAANSSAVKARQSTDRINHPHTRAHVTAVLAVAAMTAGDYDMAVLAAQEARATAIEHDFQYWVPWADVVIAACLARSAPRVGYEKLEIAMTAYRATGALQQCPLIYGLLSAAAMRDGQGETALLQANCGLALTAQSGCNLYRPELQRRRARALAALGREDEANDAFEAGFEAASAMGTTLFAHRAAQDALRLTRGQAQIGWQERYHSFFAK